MKNKGKRKVPNCVRLEEDEIEEKKKPKKKRKSNTSTGKQKN